MKKAIILLIISTASIAGFSQKAKNNLKTNKVDTERKVYTCPNHPEITSNTPGKCPKCNSDLVLSKKEQMKMEVMKIYTCPMHPEITSNKPGKCSKCGMDLVAKSKR